MKKYFIPMQMLLVGMCCLYMACSGGESGSKTLPPSKGLPYELLLVVDENLWKSPAGDSLRKELAEAPMPGLPQVEHMFRTVRLYPKHFTQMYVTMRNILVVKTNPALNTVRMGVARNVEAAPQVYVSVETPDAEALMGFLSRNGDRIAEVFVSSELALEQQRLEQKYNTDVDKASQSIFGCRVNVPAEVGAIKRGEDFLWASTDRVDQDMNYVCYALPYMPVSELMTMKWVDWRDSVMQRNIPGSTPRQWMTTTRMDGVPLTEQCRIMVNGREACEMRGLWEMRSGGLGGPFVAVAYPDSAAGRTLVAEAFIYSPRTPKRDLLRRMEAALRTLRPAER